MSIEKETFEKYMVQSDTFEDVTPEHSDFWAGYQRGLRRCYHGETFGTDAEHELWHDIPEDTPDQIRRQRGQGYRAGYACQNPTELSSKV